VSRPVNAATGRAEQLSLAAIVFHELGHFIVYCLRGCPVRITLQSVRPIGNVSAPLNDLALASGPAFSLLAAIVCLLVARLYKFEKQGVAKAVGLYLFSLTACIDVVLIDELLR